MLHGLDNNIDDGGQPPRADGASTHDANHGAVVHTADPFKPSSVGGTTITARADKFGDAGISVAPGKMVIGTADQHASGQGLVEVDPSKLSADQSHQLGSGVSGWEAMAAATASEPEPVLVAPVTAQWPAPDPVMYQPAPVQPSQTAVPPSPWQLPPGPHPMAPSPSQPMAPYILPTFPAPQTVFDPTLPPYPVWSEPTPPPADYAAIDMPWLAYGVAKPPRTAVTFYWAHGQQQSRYHHVIEHDHCISLVYDNRYADGDRFNPAPTEEGHPVRVVIRDLNFDGFVEIFDLHQTIGCMDLVNLLPVREVVEEQE